MHATTLTDEAEVGATSVAAGDIAAYRWSWLTWVLLATTLAALVNAGLLLRGLRRDGVYRPRPGWRWLLAQGFGAGLVMALLLAWACPPTEAWVALGHWARALELLTWIGLGALAYGVSLLALGLRPRDLMPGV